jgi:ABC-type multidrug transport system fused ATPase/permease subunit
MDLKSKIVPRPGCFHAVKSVVWPLLTANRWTAAWLAALGVIHIVSLLWIPRVVQSLFEQATRSHLLAELAWSGIKLVLAAALVSASSAMLETSAAKALFRDLQQLEFKLFEKILSLPVSECERMGVGKLYSRLRDDVPLLSPFLIGDAAPYLIIALQLAAVIILLFYIDWTLALTSILVAVVIAAANSAFTPRLRSIARRAQEEVAQLSSYLAEVLAHIGTIKACNAEESEQARFADADRTVNRERCRLQVVSRLLGEANSGLGRLGFLGIAIVGAWRIHAGALTSPLFMSSIVYINVLLYSSRSLINFTPRLATGLEAAVRIQEMMQYAPESEYFGTLEPASVRGSLFLRNISFSYDGGKPVLKGVTLQIPEGAKVAIVGPSGAGKTTLMKLMLGFAHPDSGEVLLGGYPLRDLELKFVRNHVGYVPQGSACILRRAVTENIALGLPNTDAAVIRQAAIAAQADGFISGLPRGYDSVVGADQGAFSGGQAQRIALARELLRRPRVLIMDEATSQLDLPTEHQIIETLLNVFHDTTCIVVSHRLASVRDFDLIVVMDNGRIVAAGNHAELLARSELYSTLFSLQDGPSAGEHDESGSRESEIPWTEEAVNGHARV